MFLKSLTIECFGSIVDPQIIDIEIDTGIIGVVGKNVQTGGSSAAGKSTIFKALNYCLGLGNKHPNWANPKAQVDGKFEGGGHVYKIRRGQKNEFYVDEILTASGGKEVTAAIQNLLSFPPEVIKNLTYRPQQKPGLFLSLTDSEKKTFLSQVLRLQEYEDALDKLELQLPRYRNDNDTAEALLKSAVDRLWPETVAPVAPDISKLDLLLHQKENLETTYQQELITFKDFELGLGLLIKSKDVTGIGDDETSRRRLEVQNRHLVQCTALNGSLDSYIHPLEHLENTFRAHNSNLSNLLMGLATLENKHGKLVDLLAEGRASKANFEAIIVSIENETCPTCHKQWEKDANTVALNNYKTQLNLADQRIAAALKDLEVGSQLLRSLELRIDLSKRNIKETNLAIVAAKSALATATAARDAEIKKLKEQEASELATIAAEHAARSKDLEIANVLKVAELTAQIQSQKQVVLGLQTRNQELALEIQELRNLQQQYLIQQATYQQAQKQRLEQLQAIAEAETRAQLAVSKVSAFEDLRDCIKTFIGKYSQTILDEVATETNVILSNLGNVGNLQLRIATSRTTGKGATKQEICPIFEVNGIEISVDDLSGGQRTAAWLATDLAVSTVVNRRNNGALPNWLIFDESFEGLDPATKEQALDVLKNYASDKLIFIVDHASELRDLVDIKILATGSISTPTTLQIGASLE